MDPIRRRAGMAGAVFAALAVLCGAFAAHALRDRLTPESMAIWRTAVDYQFWHALGLLVIALVPGGRSRSLTVAAIALITGIVLFSGSLYALALGAPSRVGLLTPFGGVAFVIGWLSLVQAFRAAAPR